MTISQIDRLGDRLMREEIDDRDVRLLDEYRASFSESYEFVVRTIKARLGLRTAGRQMKTTASIVAKLRREKTRLSRMQDIAGCRIVVDDVFVQDRVVQEICHIFPDVKVI